MAHSKAEQKRAYPLPVYNFRVTVDGQAMSFSEVSGIQIEYESVTYRHGLSFWEGERIKTFRFDSFISVTLKRGVMRGSASTFLYEWLTSREILPLEVSLCDEGGIPVLSWQINQSVPIKLEAPSFNADSNDVAVGSLELKARGVSLTVH